MKCIKYIIVTLTVITMTTAKTNQGQILAEEFVNTEDVYQLYLSKLSKKEIMTEKELHDMLGQPDDVEEIEDTIAIQTFTFESEQETQEVIADVMIETGSVENLTTNTYYHQVDHGPIDDFADQFADLIEQAHTEYRNKKLMKRQQVEELLGEPSIVSVAGTFHLLTYNFEEEGVDYVVVFSEDQLYAINEHSYQEENDKGFEITPKELNQLAHTSGVTYNEVTDAFGGHPDSIYHDFPNGIITYVWYSESDENFSELSFITDFNDIMVAISHENQGEEKQE